MAVELETTVTAYDLGRAHALCCPEVDEDQAFLDAWLAQGERGEFVRGFRSVDEPTRVPALLTVSLPEALELAARDVMRRERG